MAYDTDVQHIVEWTLVRLYIPRISCHFLPNFFLRIYHVFSVCIETDIDKFPRNMKKKI